MKDLTFSIITPTHSKKNLPFLLDLYDSICAQTHPHWEWVLYVNGELNLKDLPRNIRDDKRVRTYMGESHANVGYVKNKAFGLGKGDILVEVDHDDLLQETCLSRLQEAFADPKVGFAYSEDLLYDMRGPQHRIPWNPENGWTHEWQHFRGEDYIKINSFPPTSHSIGIIWYAPDHVRAWRSSVYHALGGHNAQLNICDDHELVIRSYLATQFAFVPQVLYYYRFLPDGDNTQLQRNESIQVKTFELFHEYGERLALRDADLRGLKKISLGNGDCEEGYTSVGGLGADVVCDLNQGIPLPDNSVGVLRASHVLQKLQNPQAIMSEIHRVLADGGWAMIEVPSTDGRGAFQDPTHVSWWNENSFWYYTRTDKAQFINNTATRFQEWRLETTWWPHHIAVTTAWLVAIKSDARRPHPVRI